MHIGEKVKFFRKRAGLSQQNLEVQIGAGFGHMSRIESGKTNPTKETLEDIARVLELDFNAKSYFLGIKIHDVSSKDIRKATNALKEEVDNHYAPASLLSQENI